MIDLHLSAFAPRWRFLYAVRIDAYAEDGTDSTFRAAANLTGPADKPFSVPLRIFLVVRRHMLLNGAVLVEFAIQSGMGTNCKFRPRSRTCTEIQPRYHGFLATPSRSRATAARGAAMPLWPVGQALSQRAIIFRDCS